MATKVLEDGRMDYHELLEATVLFLLEAKVPFQGEVFNNIYEVFARYMLFGGLENPTAAETT